MQHTTRMRVGGARLAALLGALAVGALAAQVPAAQQPSEIGVVITGEPGVPPSYAVPDFAALTPAAAEHGRTLAQVLWDDLNFEREFYLIPRDTYRTIPAARTVQQVPFEAWRELGADAVVFGTVAQQGSEITVTVQLINVRSRQAAFSKQYTGPARSLRTIAHTIADEVHLEQRGLTGVARTKLAFVSDRDNESITGTVESRRTKEIYLSDYDGANQQRVTVTRQLNINPAWSPDGSTLAYAAFRNNGAADIFLSFIYKGVLRNLTNAPRAGDSLPVFSPDGTRILFASTRDGASAPDLYVINVDGTGLRRLTNHPASDTTPTWSPSGQQIAFTSDRAGAEQVYYMNADGSNLQRLPVTDPRSDRPTWAPAPYNEIAYNASTDTGWQIKVHELITGTTRQLTFGEGSNESPAYSPTGRHIAFTSTRSGRSQVYTMNRLGDGLRQLTRDGTNQTPAWSR